jgi:hypothetical protein
VGELDRGTTMSQKRPQIANKMLRVAIGVGVLFNVVWFLSYPIRGFIYLWYLQYVFLALAILYFLMAAGAAYFYLMKESPLVAARAWGILGGVAACLSLLPIGILALPFTIGGAVLALKKPKPAGVLMLAGAVVSWIIGYQVAALVVWGISCNGLPPGSAYYLLTITVLPFLLAGCLLIPGGILALTRKERPASIKMVVLSVIGAFFLGLVIFITGILGMIIG